MSAVYAQHCCGTTMIALMLAMLASTKHCITCSDQFGGKVCFLTSMVTYALASHVNAASVHLSSPLVYCNLCTFHMVLGTVSLADFFTGHPKTKAGYDAILVFVDRLTKYVHVVPTTTKCTAKIWADSFIQHEFCNHGLPLEVILTEVHSLLASTTKPSLIACASQGACQQHFTLRLMVKQNA